jgi:hypothetical protein
MSRYASGLPNPDTRSQPGPAASDRTAAIIITGLAFTQNVRQRSSVSIWSPDPWTRPGTGGHDGRCGTKPALNAFAIAFGDRFPAAETY